MDRPESRPEALAVSPGGAQRCGVMRMGGVEESIEWEMGVENLSSRNRTRQPFAAAT